MELENLLKHKAREGLLWVLIKPGAPRTEVINYSDAEGYFKISVAAPPMDNKANLELVKFLSKLLGAEVRIKSGHSSRKKLLSCKF